MRRILLNHVKKISLIFFSSIILFGANKVYSQTGMIDATFGDLGKVITNFHYTDRAYSSIIQPDNKIIVTGVTFNDNNNIDSFALVRYQANGKIDSTFGENGKVTTSLGIQSSSKDLILQNDGKIIVVGSATSSSSFRYGFAIARYLSNGNLDSSFGINGKLLTEFSQQDGFLNCVAFQNDKIIAGGSIGGNLAIIRYTNNGSVDSSFGQNGISQLNGFPDFELDAANSIIVQTDGKIVAVGQFDSTFKHAFFIARFLFNGQIDNSFGKKGYTSTTLVDGVDFLYSYATDVRLQQDGKLVVCGSAPNQDFGTVRYLPNGNLDSTFGVNGKVVTDFAGKYDNANSLLIQPDNKIIVAGTATENIFTDFGIVRYQANGALDSTFGDNGKIITSPNTYYDYGTSVNLQSDGKIILAGYGDDGTSGDNFTIIRYSNDIILAIAQLTFTGSIRNNSVLLDWQTCNEINNQGFYVERSSNNIKWSSLGYVSSKGNNNNCNNNYSFIDNTPLEGNNFYRLKQVDKDGSLDYSKILDINFNKSFLISIAPNPVTDLLHINGLDNKVFTSIFVFNSDGKIVQSTTIKSDTYVLKVKSFANGLYYLRVNENNLNYNFKFIKQ